MVQLCEAFIIAGLENLALKHIKLYWGLVSKHTPHPLIVD